VGFLLHDYCPFSYLVAVGDIPDFQFYQVAAPELAIDGQVEQGKFPYSLMRTGLDTVAWLQSINAPKLIALVVKRKCHRADFGCSGDWQSQTEESLCLFMMFPLKDTSQYLLTN
jgi:hypothetical protein